MKKVMFLLPYIIITVLALSGCSSNQQTPNETTHYMPSDETTEEPSKESIEAPTQETTHSEEAIQKAIQKVKAKALYITGNVAGFKFKEENINYYVAYINAINGQSAKSPDISRLNEINKLEKVLGIAKASEINALVIDIKNDYGHVTWPSNLEIIKEVGSNVEVRFIDYTPLMDYLKQNEIYSIARVVAFKDPLFAKAKPECAIKLNRGRRLFRQCWRIMGKSF